MSKSSVGMNESRYSQAKCLEKQEQSSFIEELGKKIILKKQNHVANSKGLQLTRAAMGELTAVLTSRA